MLLIAALLAVPALASAASFMPSTPAAGFGDQPALAQITGAALAPGGSSVVAGSASGWTHGGAHDGRALALGIHGFDVLSRDRTVDASGR
jgi:hypothetical protein